MRIAKKLLEEKTDGGIQVDIYPAGQLGSEASMLEQVCDGTIQGFRGGQLEIVPRMLVFSLPFLCEDRTRQNGVKLRICQGNKHGFPEKRSHHIGNRRCGRIPAVFQQRADDPQAGGSERLKMRSNGMDTINKTLEALGAEVMIVPYNDLYMALKSGAIDGQENPWVNSSGMRFMRSRSILQK